MVLPVTAHISSEKASSPLSLSGERGRFRPWWPWWWWFMSRWTWVSDR